MILMKIDGSFLDYLEYRVVLLKVVLLEAYFVSSELQ